VYHLSDTHFEVNCYGRARLGDEFYGRLAKAPRCPTGRTSRPARAAARWRSFGPWMIRIRSAPPAALARDCKTIVEVVNRGERKQ
jgi:hypothetical protein